MEYKVNKVDDLVVEFLNVVVVKMNDDENDFEQVVVVAVVVEMDLVVMDDVDDELIMENVHEDYQIELVD